IGESLATGVLAIGRPVATAPQVDIRLGAGPIAVPPIPRLSPIVRFIVAVPAGGVGGTAL
ncbi:MAG: hypothetical protein KJO89_00005, partial [Deltaproteobacteria bacterium]|nr:hypothetical protein [Deltaproteobacteria bacterium]